MKNLISKEYSHLLWKDEIGDEFLLLKYAEIYRYSENTIMILTWSYPKRITIVRKNIVIKEDAFEDGLYGLLVDRSNLGFLIDLGAFKIRPNLKGNWIKGKEDLLGHKIIPYNPQSLNKIDDNELMVSHSNQPYQFGNLEVSELSEPEIGEKKKGFMSDCPRF